MTFLIVPGHLPGDKCPSCDKGWLIMVCVWDKQIIDRVACTNCSTSYETSLRGKDVEHLLHGEIERHLAHGKRPQAQTCRAHRKIMLREGVYGRGTALSSSRKYRFCQACLKVCWIGESEDEQKVRELAKDATPELKLAVKQFHVSIEKSNPRIRH